MLQVGHLIHDFFYLSEKGRPLIVGLCLVVLNELALRLDFGHGGGSRVALLAWRSRRTCSIARLSCVAAILRGFVVLPPDWLDLFNAVEVQDSIDGSTFAVQVGLRVGEHQRAQSRRKSVQLRLQRLLVEQLDSEAEDTGATECLEEVLYTL